MSEGPRERGEDRKFRLLGCAAVSFCLIAILLGWQAYERARSREQRELETKDHLRIARVILADFAGNHLPPPHSSAGGLLKLSDVVGVLADAERRHDEAEIKSGRSTTNFDVPSSPLWHDLRLIERDGWGQLLLYRCPGPLHPRGWDLYSVGENGVDELGGGDDILVGEDLAPLTTRSR